jgi:hypothetical protein
MHYLKGLIQRDDRKSPFQPFDLPTQFFGSTGEQTGVIRGLPCIADTVVVQDNERIRPLKIFEQPGGSRRGGESCENVSLSGYDVPPRWA